MPALQRLRTLRAIAAIQKPRLVCISGLSAVWDSQQQDGQDSPVVRKTAGARRDPKIEENSCRSGPKTCDIRTLFAKTQFRGQLQGCCVHCMWKCRIHHGLRAVPSKLIPQSPSHRHDAWDRKFLRPVFSTRFPAPHLLPSRDLHFIHPAWELLAVKFNLHQPLASAGWEGKNWE